MARAPFQVIVIPYRYLPSGLIQYAIFYRTTKQYGDFWQAISGGGEDDETPLQAAQRETFEESGLDPTSKFIPLDSMATIPAPQAAGMLWGPEVLVVPEYAFGVFAGDQNIEISHEHKGFLWVDYEDASRMLEFDSNRNALWELDYRLTQVSKPI